MTNEQLITWAKKTRNSIGNYCEKNAGINRLQSQRAYELIDRYTDLIDEMQERGTFTDFCNSIGSHDQHNAYDLFA